MNEDKDVVDFFTEELNKKEKKLQKKKEKEKKLQEKKNKKLEKMEDIEFAKRLEEKKSEKNEDFDLNHNSLEMTRANLFNFDSKEKKYPFLNFVLGLFLVILFLVSCDYFIYSVLKEKNLKIIITSSLLCCLSICYILSIIIKKESIKKIFQILASISIVVYMAYYLFIV